jgi:hypothetical protein
MSFAGRRLARTLPAHRVGNCAPRAAGGEPIAVAPVSFGRAVVDVVPEYGLAGSEGAGGLVGRAAEVSSRQLKS